MTRVALMLGVAAMAVAPGICSVAADGADPNAGGGGGAPAAFDAEKILAGTVDAISTGLADLSDEQLVELKAAEGKGGKRAGVASAIDRESGARAEKKGAEDNATANVTGALEVLGKDRVAALIGFDKVSFDPDDVTAAAEAVSAAELAKLEKGMAEMGYAPDGGPIDATIADKALFALTGVAADRDELKDRVAELERQIGEANGTDGSGAPLYNQVQVDKLLADLRTSMEAERDQAVKEAKTMAEAKPRKREKTKALAIGEALSPDDFATALREHASQVVLVDDEDVPIAELTPLAFYGSAYNFAGGRAILTEKIEPPRGAPGREVLGAFVLVDGKPIGRAQLVAPFEIGGGRHTELPGGTLSFGPGADD